MSYLLSQDTDDRIEDDELSYEWRLLAQSMVLTCVVSWILNQMVPGGRLRSGTGTHRDLRTETHRAFLMTRHCATQAEHLLRSTKTEKKCAPSSCVNSKSSPSLLAQVRSWSSNHVETEFGFIIAKDYHCHNIILLTHNNYHPFELDLDNGNISRCPRGTAAISWRCFHRQHHARQPPPPSSASACHPRPKPFRPRTASSHRRRRSEPRSSSTIFWADRNEVWCQFHHAYLRCHCRSQPTHHALRRQNVRRIVIGIFVRQLQGHQQSCSSPSTCSSKPSHQCCRFNVGARAAWWASWPNW